MITKTRRLQRHFVKPEKFLWVVDKTMSDWTVQYDEDIIEYGTELELQDVRDE